MLLDKLTSPEVSIILIKRRMCFMEIMVFGFKTLRIQENYFLYLKANLNIAHYL